MRKSHGMVQMFSALIILAAPTVAAQSYPSKPIRIVTAGVGGSNDFVSRVLAQGISGQVGQPVIVDNRASGFIPGEIVARAAPDGYTLLVAASNFWIAPLIQKTPYDPITDFLPVTQVSAAPLLVVVHPPVANSIKDLIALAKARPGELNYASGPAGAPNHLGPELFKAMAGVNIVRIPYNSGGPAVIGLIGGQVQLMFASAASVAPHVKAGRLKALAVTSRQPSALAPGLPPLAATVPGYESVSAQGVFAPARTPATIINRVNAQIVRVLQQPDVKEKFSGSGVETVGSSPVEFSAAITSEISKMRDVIRDAGIKAD